MLMSFDSSSTGNELTAKLNNNNIACKSAHVIFAGGAPPEDVALVSQHAPQRMPMILSHPNFASQTGAIVVELVDGGASSFGRCEEVQTAFRVCFENLFGSCERSRVGLTTNKSMQSFLHNLSASVVSTLGKRKLNDETKTKIRNAAQIVMQICTTLQNWLPLDEENTVDWQGCHVLCFVLEITNPRLFDSALPSALVVFLEQVFEVVVKHERKKNGSRSPTVLSSSSSCNLDALLNIVATIDGGGPSNWIAYSPVWRRVRYVIRPLNELFEIVSPSPSSPRRSPLLRSW